MLPTDALDAAFRGGVAALTRSATSPPSPDAWSAGAQRTTESDLSPNDLWRLFEAQASSRQLDVVARELQARGRAYYTISSAGHESNALVALASRPTDPALLHYRSGGFYAARAAQVAGTTPVQDVLQGLMGLADEPIAGGRHKVFGHPDLAVIPQTSTIASHLPRAVGLALSIARATRLGVGSEWPSDSVVLCSFGDASANHSTAAGAINTAINTAYRGLAVPIVFVCEDNGLGVSVPTPPGWIATAYGARPGLHYCYADGADPQRAWPVVAEAVALARRTRQPVFLHLRTVRFLGHAGSDAEISYRLPREIEADYARDPLLGTAAALVGLAAAETAELLARYDAIGEDVRTQARTLTGDRQLESAPEIMAPLSPRSTSRVRELAASMVETQPELVEGHSTGSGNDGRTLAESINATLDTLLARDPRVIVFGEDVGIKGGVYGVTRGLARRHGAARVFDTILDEQSILGLGLGAGLAGLLPIAEIQYLAYLHNAEDQLRGEAASLSFFSRGRFRNPLVVRVAGLAYQKGFGGHFHNDNAVGVLRDIPGLVVACPSRGDDAAAMLRTCVAAASVDGTVSVFLEPIALYHRRDLYEPGDGRLLTVDEGGDAPIGRARRHGPEKADLTLVTFGNGVPM
ncbi:MAG: thiamine pyrophosphate-dependent enzyme, partial [Propionibacteriaceae bacterium]